MANYLKTETLTRAEYAALQNQIDQHVFYFFSDPLPGGSFGAFGGNSIQAAGGGGGGGTTQTYLTTSNETATLPNSVSLGGVAPDNIPYVVTGLNTTGVATVSSSQLVAQGVMFYDGATLAPSFAITTPGDNFTVTTGGGDILLYPTNFSVSSTGICQVTTASGFPINLTTSNASINMVAGLTSALYLDNTLGNSMQGNFNINGTLNVLNNNTYLTGSAENTISVQFNQVAITGNNLILQGGAPNAAVYMKTAGSEASIQTWMGAGGATGTISEVASLKEVSVDTMHLTATGTIQNTADTWSLSAFQTQFLGATIFMSSLPSGTGLTMVWDSGQLKTQVSALKYKENVAPLAIDTAEVYKIQPVTFNFKDTGQAAWGVIADHTPESLDCLVVRDKEGEVLSFAYDKLALVLLEEMKRLKTRIEVLEAK
jgi:hypothetical protein